MCCVDLSQCRDMLPNETLMQIIAVQTEIMKLGVDLAGIMDFVTDKMLGLTGSSAAIIELAEQGEMVYRSASGSAKNQLGLRLNMATSLSGLCVDKMDVLKCDDSEDDARVDREACRKVGLRSMVVAPLSHLDTVVGVLKIVSPQPSFFQDQQITILQIMSQMIAASMYYSAKYEITELYHKATHDALTGLANRALFYDRLRQCMAMAARRSTGVGVLNIDLDGLKSINDVYGHRAGDVAIREFANRAACAVRETDTVARLGGDEFGIVLPDIKDKSDIEATVRRINDNIVAPFCFDNLHLKLEASMGCAMFPEDAKGIEDLIEIADRLMYRNKQAKKKEGGPHAILGPSLIKKS